MNAIDLYSGIGGWTLGMKLSEINNVASYEWWYEANQTHNFNFNTNHKEIDIRKINVEDLKFEENIDFVVGSPPCTQFSFANKGGNGDIDDGLVDIYKFLEVVEYLKPKYWAMENVPRVAGILEKELQKGNSLHRFQRLVKTIRIIDSADYGVPQNRKRMIAGDFPVNLFEAYKKKIKHLTLGEVLTSLSGETIIDPNYGYKLLREQVTELENEASLTPQEERINKDAKTYHPIYNKMSFPDKLDRPSRTVTATCTRVSRESIIVKTNKGEYRRLNVRERGVIQGFPITYQFYGRTLNAKFKMIGNAVPPILTYYIFQSMLEVPSSNLLNPTESQYYHETPPHKSVKSNLGLPKRKYPAKRKFKFAVPNLRYGSGVRFELSNDPKSNGIPWSFKFFHGNSKNIKEIKLNQEIKNSLAPVLNTDKNEVFTESIIKIATKYKDYESSKLQKLWTSSDLNTDVFDFLDEVGQCVNKILTEANLEEFEPSLVTSITEESNKKIEVNYASMLAGFYFLSSLNTKLFN
ncbi:MAG: DNA (cytosine-5-)-methyltransferase [Chitinophagales bacterium]|nr:DNA (cytosine-5-)-methyltransferase [Chitinophagales bacterium]